ncbi:sensor histidine kinase KdpD [Gordonia sp. HY442]|uniref:sensor histidine kinase n=1 Tax=Gordonia zhenghanii TaxID=2911516 RepID=UPI001F2327CD|nr:sensor histidine kinase KdpD [Gordonia zhenghanii]MCF8607418.1 sensor histidine kinase KdpD [Gordonia zhenghanii]
MTASGEARRGQLEVFLGCAPGVGKTYEMLAQARALRDDGADVVVGIVETHGRAATAAMLDGLETVPRRPVSYRGALLDEMDLDAVLARAPEVVLVDELAHTNAPGSANTKRWEDVEVLRAAGVDVLSTVNIQHLESLNDVVEQITGVIQQETVPDAAVRSADQIELVDIEPKALRQRLSAGKVYGPARIDEALVNFFRQGNLTALRELALLWLADRVDEKLADYRSENSITATWEARERVVVAVTGGAETATLVRRASRIASRSSAELTVVHVVRGDGLADRGAADLSAVRALAADLGAGLHTVVGGDDVPAALLDFARGNNATQLVVGTSRRSRWRQVLDEGVGARVVRDSGRIDVHIVNHEQARTARRLDMRRARFYRPLSWALAIVVPLALTGVVYLLDGWLGFSSESSLFFVGVLVVAMAGGVFPAALSALASGLLLNYFFADPRFDFTIAEPDNAVTLTVMLIIAVAVAVLVDSATVRRVQAQRAAHDAELLALFSTAVLDGAGVADLLERVRVTYQQTGARIVHTAGETETTYAGRGPFGESATECTAYDGAYRLELAGPPIDARDRRVLTAVANQVSAAAERARLAAEAAVVDELSRTDELRRALLAAVSHDLRTPLAAAKAAASSLRSDDVTFSDEDTADLLATVEESVDQLSALVGNLLDSSRLAAGVVRPHLRPTFLPEVIHRATAAVALRDPAAADAVVTIDEPWAMTDGGLLERALANLVDNALRHGSRDVEVAARRVCDDEEPWCRISVTDHGAGIPADEASRIFVPFHQYGDNNRATAGVGLGLSVAEGFVSAVGGTLSATPTPGGGATMVIDLPVGEAGVS